MSSGTDLIKFDTDMNIVWSDGYARELSSDTCGKMIDHDGRGNIFTRSGTFINHF